MVACNEVKRTLGHKVFVPNTLELLVKSDFSMNKANPKEKLKLVCLIDANCEERIHRVNGWQGLVDSLQQLGINTHIILQTTNVRSFKEYLFNKFETNAIYYLDSNYSYYVNNKNLFTNDKLNAHVLLLDSTNTIQMYGDPFLNQSTKEIYLFAINKFLNDKNK